MVRVEGWPQNLAIRRSERCEVFHMSYHCQGNDFSVKFLAVTLECFMLWQSIASGSLRPGSSNEKRQSHLCPVRNFVVAADFHTHHCFPCTKADIIHT